jgi:two-component system sensor histidine kinase BaeS
MASQKLTNCCVAAIALVTAAYLCTPHSSTISRLAFGAFCLAIHSFCFLAKASIKEFPNPVITDGNPMKISIKYRLFLAFLLATCTLVGCMFLIMKISFDRGFLRYINNIEQARLEKLAVVLETSYTDDGNWDFLRNEPAACYRLLAETLPEEYRVLLRSEQERLSKEGLPRDSRPPRRMMRHAPHMFEWRVLLLDADRRQIFGPNRLHGDINLHPLKQESRIIGYLGIVPPRNIADPLQLRFVQKQRQSFALIALIMAGAAALLSIPLAQQLVKRITVLAGATHRLAAGQYDTRVPAAASDELGQLSRDFNSLAQTLQKNEQLRRQWMADISHELRTPLAVLRGEIEAIQDGVRPQTPLSLNVLHGEVMHLSRLVDDLYQLSLADIGALTYRKEPIDLGEALLEAIELFRGEFETRDIRITHETPTVGSLILLADNRRLHQLFSNLLENSLRYTDTGGELRIRLAKGEDQATIDFEDSAPGVPEDKLNRLFDRLFRVEGSRSRATGGAGLGLAMCKNIVEAHDGTIVARPSPLGGLWVEISLPLKG